MIGGWNLDACGELEQKKRKSVVMPTEKSIKKAEPTKVSKKISPSPQKEKEEKRRKKEKVRKKKGDFKRKATEALALVPIPKKKRFKTRANIVGARMDFAEE